MGLHSLWRAYTHMRSYTLTETYQGLSFPFKYPHLMAIEAVEPTCITACGLTANSLLKRTLILTKLTKVKSRIGFLYQNKSLFTHFAKQLLVKLIVISIFDHCNIIYKSASQRFLHKLVSSTTSPSTCNWSSIQNSPLFTELAFTHLQTNVLLSVPLQNSHRQNSSILAGTS